MIVRVILLTMAMTISLPALSQSQSHDTSEMISATGCVQAGVENACTVLKDSKTGETYNLFFGSKAPKANTAIVFQGTAHQGMTTCMQGKAVDVKKWKRAKGIDCPKNAATEHPQ